MTLDHNLREAVERVRADLIARAESGEAFLQHSCDGPSPYTDGKVQAYRYAATALETILSALSSPKADREEPRTLYGLAAAIRKGFESIEPIATEEPCAPCAGSGISGYGCDAGGCDDCGGTGVQYGCDWSEEEAWSAAAKAAQAYFDFPLPPPPASSEGEG